MHKLQLENYVDDLRRSFGAGSAEGIKYPEVVAETFDIPNYGGEILSVGRFHEDISLYSRGPHDIVFDVGKCIITKNVRKLKLMTENRQIYLISRSGRRTCFN